MPASKILFVGHKAERTGAPLILLEFIKWISKNSEFVPEVLLKQGGELEDDYRKVAPTTCYFREEQRLNRGLARRIIRRMGTMQWKKPDLARRYPVEEYPIVFANTMDTCDLTAQLAKQGRRFVHRIPELPYVTDSFGATELLSNSVEYTDLYIAVGNAVKSFLETEIRVPSEKIRVIHGFPIPRETLPTNSAQSQSIRAQLGIPEDAIVVGMSGFPSWRKGVDLFVQLADRVNSLVEAEPCHFIWLGGQPQWHKEGLHDVRKLGLDKVVHFMPSVADPYPYYSSFDIFALTSREEPFSVSMLEAAECGLPIICFANAGGAPELVGDDAGIIVPYLDINEMANACVRLLKDQGLRDKLGSVGRQRVITEYTLAKQGPKILDSIRGIVAKQN